MRLLPRLVLAAALALAACAGGDAPTADAPAPASTGSFALLQARVLTPQCAGCHAAGTPTATQSGLVLDAARAYSALVGAQAANANARRDGLLRVAPGKPDSSLLYHKLVWTPGHHAADYGNPMPLGTTAGISAGELEFVRRWIAAGAPRDGAVAPAALLDDRTAQALPPFAPPERPARGVQLAVDSFSVAPAFERELFVLRPLGNAQEVFVDRFEFRMRPGSHHLLLYDFDASRSPLCAPALLALAGVAPGRVRDIRNPDGSMNALAMAPMGCHVFVAGSMTPSFSYQFPPGVALRLRANAALDVNVHYVNRGGAPIPGEAYANLHTVDPARVQRAASTLDLGNTSFSLPPGQRTTVTKEFVVGSAALPLRDSVLTVFALTSHMHSRGERFVVRLKGGARDGQVVYENADWEHPAMTTFTPPLVLRRGEALVSVVTFNNTTARTLRFGLTSEDEMAIVFGYYY
jgi:hypothetical protein